LLLSRIQPRIVQLLAKSLYRLRYFGFPQNCTDQSIKILSFIATPGTASLPSGRPPPSHHPVIAVVRPAIKETQGNKITMKTEQVALTYSIPVLARKGIHENRHQNDERR